MPKSKKENSEEEKPRAASNNDSLDEENQHKSPEADQEKTGQLSTEKEALKDCKNAGVDPNAPITVLQFAAAQRGFGKIVEDYGEATKKEMREVVSAIASVQKKQEEQIAQLTTSLNGVIEYVNNLQTKQPPPQQQTVDSTGQIQTVQPRPKRQIFGYDVDELLELVKPYAEPFLQKHLNPSPQPTDMEQLGLLLQKGIVNEARKTTLLQIKKLLKSNVLSPEDVMGTIETLTDKTDAARLGLPGSEGGMHT